MPPALCKKVVQLNLCEWLQLGSWVIMGTRYGINDKNEAKIIDEISNQICDMKYNRYKDYKSDAKWYQFTDWFQINYFQRNDQFHTEIQSIVDRINNGLNMKHKPIKLSEFMSNIYNDDYTIHLEDGGVNSNSPLLFGCVDALRLWPTSDIVMLSIGTGRTFEKDVFKSNKSPILAANLFNSIFKAKEVTTLSQMISLSSADHNDSFYLQRLNPEIDAKYTDMANSELMPYWRNHGEKFAQQKTECLKHWASFLVNNYYQTK